MQEFIKNKELHKNVATQLKESTLAKLREIDGLDSVDWWPLAPVWWVIIAFTIFVIIYITIKYLQKRAWRLSWKGQVYNKLDRWQQKLNQNNAQEIAIKVSRLVRRMAMHENTRKECASLVENKWLLYLQQKSDKFDWQTNGEVLIEGAFAPKGTNISVIKLNSILIETKKWVRYK